MPETHNDYPIPSIETNEKKNSTVADGKLLSEIRNFNSNNCNNNNDNSNNEQKNKQKNKQNFMNDENFKVDKRLSINHKNICISSPHRNGRRNRSRRHLIYVPSLTGNVVEEDD